MRSVRAASSSRGRRSTFWPWVVAVVAVGGAPRLAQASTVTLGPADEQEFPADEQDLNDSRLPDSTEKDSTEKKSFINGENMTKALHGMIAGIKPDQLEEEQEGCYQALSSLAPSLRHFFQEVVSGCSKTTRGGPLQAGESTDHEESKTCVQTILAEFGNVSNLTKAATVEIDRRCPAQFNIIFTAAYDPLLPFNMLVLFTMHVFEFRECMRMMFAALSHSQADFYQFGFHLGSGLEKILPLVRLPPKKSDLREVTRGLVHAFTDTREVDSGAVSRILNDGLSSPFDSDNCNASERCLDYVQKQLEEVYGPLLDITMGSLLNYTCYKKLIMLDSRECWQRAATGLASLSSSLFNMYTLIPDLRKAACPSRFIEATRRFDSKANITLDLITNIVLHASELEMAMRECTELFLKNHLYHFGYHLGVVLDQSTEPSFYRFQQLSFPVSQHSLLEQVLYLAFLKSLIAACAACPLLLLFCSACYGRPAKYQEIAIASEEDGAPLAFTFEFFGGQLELGSEIELLIETREEAPEQVPFEECARPQRGNVSKTKYLHCTALKIRECASYCMLLTLTNELPEMSRSKTCAYTILGMAAPCLAGGARRWKLQTFSRRQGEWQEEKLPQHVGLHFSSWLKRTLPQLMWPVDASAISSSSEDDSMTSSEDTEIGQDGGRDVLMVDGEIMFKPPSHRHRTPASAGGFPKASASSPSASPKSPEEDDCRPGVEAKFFLDNEHVRPPVLDRPVSTMLSASHLQGAVLRVRPQEPMRECCDVLLLASAFAQFALSGYQLLVLLLVHLPVVFRGEMLTLWFHWDRCVVALLVIHKKLHARWYREENLDRSMQLRTRRERGFGCCGAMQRTPTVVPLTTPAPSTTARRKPLPSMAMCLLAYRLRYHVGAGDRVRVKDSRHRRSGQSGVLLDSALNHERRLGVAFGSETDWLERSSLSLEERADHAPMWHDRLTGVLVSSTLALWSTSLLLLLLCGGALSDSEGGLLWSLQSDRDPWQWSLGFLILVQCVCIFIEASMRVTQWCLLTCSQAMIYR